MKPRLPSKLALTFFLLTTALLGLTCLLLGLRTRQALIDETTRYLRRDAIVAKGFVERALGEGAFPAQADPLADRLGRELGLRVTLITPDGTVVGDSEVDADGLAAVENHAGRPEVRDAIRTGLGRSIRESATVHRALLYLALPVHWDGELTGVVRLALSLHHVEGAATEMWWWFLSAFLAAVALAWAVSLVVGAWVSRPILEISTVARRLAAGDFQERLGLRASDEIGELAGSLNTLAAQARRRLEELAAAKHQLETIIEGLGEGLIVTDAHQRVLLVNSAFTRLFGITEPPEGRPLLDVVRVPALARVVEEALKARGAAITDEALVAGADERWLRLHAVALWGDEGGGSRMTDRPRSPAGVGREATGSHGVVCLVHDVTDLRRLERIRRDFVANVSHELRTPLTSIRGYAETLKDGAVGDARQAQEFSEVIYQEADRLTQVISDFLELSKIESGAAVMDLRPVAVDPVVRQVLQTLRPAIERKQLTCQLDVPSDAPPVLADPRALHQILLNLMDNAVKYTPERGRVRIAARVAEGMLHLSVEDTGIGIPAEHLPRIFERFYRVDKSRSVELGGTGLGLAIVKHLVQAMRGRVWAESTPERGSTFSFVLPIA